MKAHKSAGGRKWGGQGRGLGGCTTKYEEQEHSLKSAFFSALEMFIFRGYFFSLECLSFYNTWKILHIFQYLFKSHLHCEIFSSWPRWTWSPPLCFFSTDLALFQYCNDVSPSLSPIDLCTPWEAGSFSEETYNISLGSKYIPLYLNQYLKTMLKFFFHRNKNLKL